MAERSAGTVAAVLFDSLHPVAPATPPHGSITGWVLFAVVLALIVAGGVVLASRR